MREDFACSVARRSSLAREVRIIEIAGNADAALLRSDMVVNVATIWSGAISDIIRHHHHHP